MRKLLFSAILLTIYLYATAQCPVPAGPPDGPCTGTPATDNVNINSGDVYSYSGAATTFSSVSMNSGGTLQICGTLTIQNLNFNGGAIVIMSGGSLTIGGININALSSVTNYGTITINGSLNVGGANGLFLNFGTATVNGSFSLTSATADFVNGSPTAIFNAGSNQGTLSGEFVNLGKMTFGTLAINGGADLCLGPNSEVNAIDINNNVANGIMVEPSGSNACIKYSGNALLNSSLSSESQLMICQAPGATVSGSGGFGNAVVSPNCTNCITILPVVLTKFQALINGQSVNICWTSSMEENTAGYSLEKSSDGNQFTQAAFIPAMNTPSTYHYQLPLQPILYLRLRMQDRDGNYSHSRVIYVKSDDIAQDMLKALCSPCHGDQLAVRMISRQAQNGRLLISNMSGQVIKQTGVKLEAGQQDLQVPISGLAAGLYTVTFIGSRYTIGPVRWIKGR